MTLISGKKKKVIEPGHWIEVSTVDPTATFEDKCFCPSWSGQFIGFNENRLQLQVHRMVTVEPIDDTTRIIRTQTLWGDLEALPFESINSDGITSITLKGKGKKMRDETVIETVGMLLTIAGIGAIASTPIVEERGELAVTGLAEICVGLILVASTKQKRIYLSDHIEEENVRIWKIVPN